MPAIKLCIIGGGSQYTHHMLYTFAQHVATGDLAGSTISLYDINQEASRLMANFGNSVARAKKLDFRLEAEASLEKALEGSDFVFSSIRVGGYEQLEWDESVPRKYGLFGQETTGVSGTFMICRQTPAIIEHIKTIIKVCPDTILINYSNPSGMVTELTQRLSNINCLGLCDGVYAVRWLLCHLMGVPLKNAKDITAYVAGVNHCTWSLGLRYQGEDLYPRVGKLFEKYERESRGDKEKELIWKESIEPYYRIYRYYGLLPGSAAYTRYHFWVRSTLNAFARPENYLLSRDLKAQAKEIYLYIRSKIDKEDADFMPSLADNIAHGDQAMGVLWKMACDTGQLEIVNVRNNGIISNLPDEAVVEVPAIMNRQGAMPLAMGPLPKSVVADVRATATHYSLSVDAAMSGDKKLIMQAAMAFPSNVDIDLMEECINELFEKHKDWLPQFSL